MHCDQCGSMIPERKAEVTQYTLCYLCFCYHSISFYICKSFQYQFLDGHKSISLSLQFINNKKCCIYG